MKASPHDHELYRLARCEIDKGFNINSLSEAIQRKDAILLSTIATAREEGRLEATSKHRPLTPWSYIPATAAILIAASILYHTYSIVADYNPEASRLTIAVAFTYYCAGALVEQLRQKRKNRHDPSQRLRPQRLRHIPISPHQHHFAHPINQTIPPRLDYRAISRILKYSCNTSRSCFRAYLCNLCRATFIARPEEALSNSGPPTSTDKGILEGTTSGSIEICPTRQLTSSESLKPGMCLKITPTMVMQVIDCPGDGKDD